MSRHDLEHRCKDCAAKIPVKNRTLLGGGK